MRWIVRGDIDGFFGLAVDNLVQLLLIDTLCRTVLGFPPELVYGRVLPAAAISILVGNVAYAFQARALAARTGRQDVCALPYGINTVSLFAHVFLVMLPAKALAERMGAPDPARVAWHAGLIATLATGIIELACAFIAGRSSSVCWFGRSATRSIWSRRSPPPSNESIARSTRWCCPCPR